MMYRDTISAPEKSTRSTCGLPANGAAIETRPLISDVVSASYTFCMQYSSCRFPSECATISARRPPVALNARRSAFSVSLQKAFFVGGSRQS